MCVPSDGNSFTLRQNYQTQLSVGCVGTGLISKECVNGCTTYNFELPGGLDLVLCLQEIVSIKTRTSCSSWFNKSNST